jgi:hypothetical protein
VAAVAERLQAARDRAVSAASEPGTARAEPAGTAQQGLAVGRAGPAGQGERVQDFYAGSLAGPRVVARPVERAHGGQRASGRLRTGRRRPGRPRPARSAPAGAARGLTASLPRWPRRWRSDRAPTSTRCRGLLRAAV